MLIPETPKKPTRDLFGRAFENATVVDVDIFPWTVLQGERHLATCGHDI